jgi:AraC-like DNA-binding protein
MSELATSMIDARIHGAPASSPLDATIIVAHASPLIRAGIVSTLKRLPRCVVQVWEQGPLRAPRTPRRPQVLIGDEVWVSQIMAQHPRARFTDGDTRVVVLRNGDAANDEAAMPEGVDRQLSIECREEELFDAVRHLSGTRPTSAPPEAPRRAPRGGLAPGALRRVREHIENRIAERITLGELATIAGLCECHFSRAFKQSVGVPPHRYVMQRRVECATRLIETTDRSLGDIAHEVGFADQSHFTRLFVEAVGETPREFRQRCR